MFDEAVEKVGGAFQLTVLLQKRVRELVRGATPLISVDSNMHPIDIALREVMEDKISLKPSGAVEEVIEPESIADEPKAPSEKKEKKKSKDKKKDTVAF